MLCIIEVRGRAAASRCELDEVAYEALVSSGLECPYLVGRVAGGFADDDFVGPSCEDQWAHLLARGPARAQGGQVVYTAIDHRGRLPGGFEPHTHTLCAASVPSPFLGNAKAADGVDSALIKVMAFGRASQNDASNSLAASVLWVMRCNPSGSFCCY